MAASDYVPIFFKNRLHLVGRPQMSTRPSAEWWQELRYEVVTAHNVSRNVQYVDRVGVACGTERSC